MDATQKATLQHGGIVVLVIIFGFSMFNTLKRLGVIGGTGASRAGSAGAHASAVSERLQPQPAGQPGEPGQEGAGPSERVEYLAEAARDPLQHPLDQPVLEEADSTPEPPPPPAAPAQVPTVTVQGIVLGGPRPQALIDRKLYEVGDTVQGARIVSITRKGVAMDVGGSVVVLRPPSPLSQPNVTRTRGGQP